jgi:hypothetical protein
MENVMHFQTMEEQEADLHVIANDLINGWLNNSQDQLLACIANDVRLTSYAARKSVEGSPTFETFPELAGLHTGTIDNSAIAACINFVPGAAPWTYGRFLLCGVPDVGMTGNTFDAAYGTLTDTFAAQVASAFVGGDPGATYTWIPGIFNRKSGVCRGIAEWIRLARPSVVSRRLRPWFG